MDNLKILLVGYGKMGAALLEGVITAGVLARNIIVIEPNRDKLPDRFNVRILKSFDKNELEGFTPDAVIFAVKPQVIGSIIGDYSQYTGKSVFISIIAGKTVSFFEKHLGANAAVIRSMPNLPATINQGITVFYSAPGKVSESQLGVAVALFKAIGEIEKIDTESQLDAVTAISGSGPAYLFHFIECLTEAAKQLGLPTELAQKLAIKTIEGSAIMASGSDKTPSQLRQAVTSPAGTTEAALKVLMENSKMQELVIAAAKAADKRSSELSE